MTRVTLVRHAESQLNRRSGEVVGGRSNHTPLTAQGQAAATELGRRIASEGPPDLVVSTSAVRSARTARAILDGAGWRLPVHVDDGLLELSQGAAEGRPREEWWTPAALAAMTADPAGHRLAPDGESHREVQHRMRLALIRIAERVGPDGHALAVGHGIAIRTLAWSLLGGGHETFRGLALPNLGRVDLLVDGTDLRLPGGVWPL